MLSQEINSKFPNGISVTRKQNLIQKLTSIGVSQSRLMFAQKPGIRRINKILITKIFIINNLNISIVEILFLSSS